MEELIYSFDWEEYKRNTEIKADLIESCLLFTGKSKILSNLEDELEYGEKSYYIPSLFSRIKTFSPYNAQVLNTTSVDFSWEGTTESYQLYCSTNPDFACSVWTNPPRCWKPVDRRALRWTSRSTTSEWSPIHTTPLPWITPFVSASLISSRT